MNFEGFGNIKAAEENSKGIISLLDSKLRSVSSPNLQVILSGSYGRKEATSGSDVDYFILHSKSCGKEELSSAAEKVREIVSSELKMPAVGGAFGESVEMSTMLENIGGDSDDNKSITRRILFMTESKPLGDNDLYRNCLDQLISKYITDKISEHQLALFLLNDFIRFYRTMCVDFENKTSERGKSWGIRNIKLIFSRKIIYFSGIILVAETAQQTPKTKREIVHRLIGLTPLERIQNLFGDRANDVLTYYNNFLGYLNDKNIRSEFENTSSDRTKHSELFRCVKNEGHHFSDALISLLNSKYSMSHPIHRSLIV